MSETSSMPVTFAELYLLACKMTDDTPEHIERYKDVDTLRQYIDSKDEDTKKRYLHSISGDRLCITIPYELFSDIRRPPDGMIDNKPIILACPEYDHLVSDLIDHMKHCVDDPTVVKWKLMILNKVYKLGWVDYCAQYLEPLKDKDTYFRMYVAAQKNEKSLIAD